MFNKKRSGMIFFFTEEKWDKPHVKRSYFITLIEIKSTEITFKYFALCHLYRNYIIPSSRVLRFPSFILIKN